jgi:hypothetical protein
LYDLKELEILLLETSGSFGNTDMAKINFDHHKGTFGCLAMIKLIVDEYYCASEKTFQKLKKKFVNAAG